jgi:sensor histidine kinase YesM
VHTILENIYKHAVSVDKLTSILISAKTEDRGGEQMCHITIEDDGEGYPEEFLKQVESGDVRVQENGHGVGLWNMKKTLELMYKRDDLIEFTNKEPHGSSTNIWIPKRAKRQSTVWKL